MFVVRLLRVFSLIYLALLGGVMPALALVEAFPATSQRTAERVEPRSTYALPIGPWADGSMLTRLAEGKVEQTAWKVPQSGASSLELIAPLRAQLAAEGWRILFECETISCGGFDFRYSTQVLPEPAMHVDLGDFRFISARRGGGEAEEHASLLVSRSAGAEAGYIQLIRVMPPEGTARAPTLGAAPASTVSGPGRGRGGGAAASSVAAALDQGAISLEGISFDTGGAGLTLSDPAQMQALAAYLSANGAKHVALVGHTDASGSLEANIALSKRRAEAVRASLIKDFGAPAGQITALGAGYMAPRASNQTEEGRALNRRVEVVLTSVP